MFFLTRIRFFLALFFSLLTSFQAMAAGGIYQCKMSGCISVNNSSNSGNYTKTRYPVVLVHGMLGSYSGFDSISSDLALNGSQVFLPKLSSVHATPVLGEQLLKQVQVIQAISGTERVNLLGHSLGGISIRYVAGVRPDLVASVTTIGAPNKGTRLADYAQLVTADPTGLSRTLVNSVVRIFGTLFDLGSGAIYSQDYQGFINTMTPAGAQAFNQRFPAGVPASACGEGAYSSNGIRFYSWSGSAPATNFFDPTDSVMIISSLFHDGQPNDGLITRCSSHFGQVLRDNYKMNHTDEINQTMGLVSWWEVNPVSVYRMHVNRLKNVGL